MNSQIIRADSHELVAVAQLFNEYRQYYEQGDDMAAVTAFIEQRLSRQDSIILIAKKNKSEGLGFLQMYWQLSSLDMSEFLIINDLFVTQSARGQGVARKLMATAIEIGINQGCKRLTLETASTNYKAQSLYETLGFRRDNHYYHYQLDI
ncbi:MAG: GNAT family N-acetyltransferase [Shewanella sp.]